MAKKQSWTEMDKSKILFSKLRQAYAVFNKTTGKSPHTVIWYDFRLELFERSMGAEAQLRDLSVARVREYVLDLQGRTERYTNNPQVVHKADSLSSSYIQGFVRALRAFSSWLYEEGYTEINVLKNLKPPRIQQKIVQVLSDDEVHRLVRVLDPNEAFGARDLAMVWTMLDCGLRASEVSSLRVDDAHLEEGYLKVLGKGNKERLVPIGKSCQAAILRWRERFRPEFVLVPSPVLFLAANGRTLTLSSLEKAVKRAGGIAGVTRVHCHLLRHTFATNYLVRGIGDPFRLQQILGHTSLEMVRRYVAAANIQSSLVEAHSSPMDLIGESRPVSRQARLVQPKRAGRVPAARPRKGQQATTARWQGRSLRQGG